MPIRQVKTPDGNIIKVSAPDGASNEQILAFAQSQYKPASPSPEMGMRARRQMVGDGQHLRVGPWDTGIEMPQGVTETLAGLGRRMTEIGTLGMNNPAPVADEMLDDSGYAAIGGAAADIGALALGGHLLKGAQAIPKVGKALSTAGQALSAPKNIKQAVTAGGLYGAATDGDRLEGALGGATGGGLGYGATKVVGNMLKPTIKQEAEVLTKRGVDLTPGELLGGWVQRVEDGATSIPFVGDFIRNSKRMSLKSFNKSMVNDALEVVGEKLDDSMPAGREALARADDILSQKYDDILGGMNVKMDADFVADFNKISQMVGKLPKKEVARFNRFMGEGLLKQFDNPNKLLLGKTFKRVDSGLRNEYKRLIKSSDPDIQDLGAAMREVHSSLLGMAKRQNPKLAESLAATDKSYAMMQRINEAAGSMGAKDGIFTPSHLVSAVKKASSKKQFSTGKGYGQKTAEAAKDVLPSTVPDSGTALRAMTGTLALGGGAYLDPSILAAMLGASGAYTKPGQYVLRSALTKRPELVGLLGNQVKQLAPYGGLLGTAGGINIPNQ